MKYSHSAIYINNRYESLADILMGKASSYSAFESTTFSVITDWFERTPEFRLHTSGSTGVPKEIKLTHHQLKQSALRTIAALELTENTPAIICLDTKYIAGKMMVIRALEGNMKIIAIEPSSNPFHELKTNLSNGFAAFVPMQISEMIHESDSCQKLNQLKTIIAGGGAVSASLQQYLNKLTCAVYATYGMTETVSHIALQRLNGKDASEYFTVLPDINITIDDRGCMVIQIPEFSNKIVTNDLIEMVSSNQFRWLGRYDNVINSGGVKISPEKIEKAIEQILPGHTFFVTGVSDERLGQKLILIIEGDSNTLDLTKLNLHPYEIPKEVYYLSGFIRTETGKINREKTKLLANSH